MQTPHATNEKGKAALDIFFRQNPRAALAFSGGTDSSLLLFAAKKNGCDVSPYFVKSQFQPQFELDDAERLCMRLGVKLTVLSLDMLEDEAVAANGPDRCYLCKKRILGAIAEAAKNDGYTLLIDGTNASDDAGGRPGMKALAEFGVRSPLAELGITKAAVRGISRDYALFTAHKPAYACLATRIPAGRQITEELLARVEKAEDALFSMGYTGFRARVVGEGVKLQFTQDQIIKAFERREQILDALKDVFTEVFLDLNPRPEEQP